MTKLLTGVTLTTTNTFRTTDRRKWASAKEANGWQRYLNRRARIKAELSKLGLTYAMPGAVSEANLANLLMNNPAAIGRLLNAAR